MLIESYFDPPPGLVDYVAGSSSTAFERALELAKEMSSSGRLSSRLACHNVPLI